MNYPTRDWLLRELDRAIIAYRDDPSEENLHTLQRRQEQFEQGFYRTNAEDYIRRTKGDAA